MSIKLKPRTADINGALWGARASDWADIQEGTVRAVYEAVLERTRVRPGTRYLDVGCGAGMAAQMAAVRGAQVSGIDAAEALGEARRLTRPGGAVVVTTWGDPDGMEAASVVAALRPLMPPPPPGAG